MTWKKILPILSVLVFCGCATGIPNDALQISPESLQVRQLQTRSFETTDEKKMLVACSNLLQDMGFTIAESQIKLGVLLGTKSRSAVSAGQQIGAVVLAFFGSYVPTDKEQLMRASVVTRPSGEKGERVLVRVTFQRIVWNTNNDITCQECLSDPKMYEEFFDKLSKAVFLEGQQI